MTQRLMTRRSKAITVALLVGTAFSTAAWAQFGGGGPLVPPAGPGAPMGGPGMPMGGGPNPPGANPFSNPFTSGRLPFANGTVTAVNAAAGTITLAPMFGGGQAQAVKVTDATQITATREGTVGDLKVGDTIQVRGVPTGITASQITQDNNGDQGMAAGMGMTGMPNAGPRPGGPGGGPGMGGPPAASAQASGKITALNPLMVSVSDSVQVTLKIAAGAKISRNVTETIGELKVGDRVMASGKAGDDGVLAAGRIRVNADFGMGLGMGR